MYSKVTFSLFIVTSVFFQFRIHRYPTRQVFDVDFPWKKHLYNLYIACALIIVQIFRAVEYAIGRDGYPLTHEWTLYVFDALLMFIVMVIYCVYFPGGLQIERPKSDERRMALDSVEDA